MFRQIVQAVKLMHAKMVCHRDLKLDNIIVMENGKPKIIDFGFAV
jgi:serine/threonine protein kinase